MSRPVHTHWRNLLLVFCGGCVGTGVREALSLAVPTAGWPSAIFAINLSGSFILGAVLEWLSRAGSDEGGRRAVRLTVGTGVLGGYTTYSALAVDAVRLASGGQWGLALGYAVGSVLGGMVAAALGVWAAAGFSRARVVR